MKTRIRLLAGLLSFSVLALPAGAALNQALPPLAEAAHRQLAAAGQGPAQDALVALVSTLVIAQEGRGGCPAVMVGDQPPQLYCYTQERISPGVPGMRQIILASTPLQGTRFSLPPEGADPTVALAFKGPDGRRSLVTFAQLDRALQRASGDRAR